MATDRVERTDGVRGSRGSRERELLLENVVPAKRD